MLIWPAIDLLEGRCVRLLRGDYDRVTEFSDDPVAVAEAFVAEGAEALHVVDLDGAREGRPVNARTVLDIRRRVDVPIQVGGGLRDGGAAARYLDAGVDRVIVGTAAARGADWVLALLGDRGPHAVAAGVDVRGGEVVVEGWREDAGLETGTVLDRLSGMGIEVVVYTDTTRDGTLTAPDVAGARQVVERGFRTLVAGGVSRPEHVAALCEAGAAGAVVGSALYEGAMSLADARRAAGGATDRRPGGGA